jgi:hypothetical protein
LLAAKVKVFGQFLVKMASLGDVRNGIPSLSQCEGQGFDPPRLHQRLAAKIQIYQIFT